MTRLHAPFGKAAHDSLQYHFRCGGLIGAARLFRTGTLDHASAWVWTGRALERLHDGRGPLHQQPGDALDVGDGALRVSEDAAGAVAVTGPGFRLGLRPRQVFRWGDTIATVLHAPDLACTFEFAGRRLEGIGYCKRYAWTPAPRHWGYRFVQGWLDDAAALWTAEATFGTAKYDYFRLLEPDGTLREGGPEASRHRQDAVVCDLPEGFARVALTELAVWEAPLVSGGMDSLLRQRVCALTVDLAGRRREGLGINETCFGTLG
jgi:hypothetical protein